MSRRRPPTPEVLAPTRTLADPARPLSELLPLCMDTQPEFPLVASRVCNSTFPDAPAEPTLADARTTEPDPELALDPDDMSNAPPAPVVP